MTPEQMAELLTAWAHNVYPYDRRVDCVEPEGPRRTWILSEGSRQVGHVRMRATPTPRRVTAESGLAWGPTRMELVSVDEWTVEASDRTRAMLGL